TPPTDTAEAPSDAAQPVPAAGNAQSGEPTPGEQPASEIAAPDAETTEAAGAEDGVDLAQSGDAQTSAARTGDAQATGDGAGDDRPSSAPAADAQADDPETGESQTTGAQTAGAQTTAAQTTAAQTTESGTPGAQTDVPAEDTELARAEPAKAEDAPQPPVIALGGAAIDVNARLFSAPEAAPLMAVVLTDTENGTIEAGTLDLLTMPLTLAIRPTGPSARALADEARRAKHEVLAELPMDASAGGAALSEDLDGNAIRFRMRAFLALLDKAIGVTASDGETPLLRNRAAMQAVIDPLAEFGFVYLEGQSGTASVAGELSGDADVPHVAANRSVPTGASDDQVFQALENAAFTAKQTGSSIVMIPASKEALTALVRWGLISDGRPVFFAPVSAVIKRRAAAN
ncbi:MAG: divergent polysaccharide deacetylase family protein, partial [Pseudomonadota bacterium]